ncbi:MULTISPECIES: MFS transporter [Acidithrix]|uniref:Multidrug resistance protein MdtG n=2 Tax=root TaxID=1 RepID=A0A0D8HLJ5_9ACTN|nr:MULTISPECIES: MFS transporter [Acidithrix]KJF18798.1 multidrug resistance protein MdtG [Acidithrix ferrooxidans]
MTTEKFADRLWQLRIIYIARALMSTSRVIAAIGVPIYFAASGFSATKLGVVFGLASIFTMVTSAIIGSISDRVGRKIFMVVYPIVVSVTLIVFISTSIAWILILCTVLGSFGRGGGAGAGQVGPYQPAESALLAEIASTKRNDAFVKVTQMTVVGALIGSAVSATLFGSLHPSHLNGAITIPFSIAAIAALLGGLVALLIQEEKKPTKDKDSKAPRRSLLPRNSMGLLFRLAITNSLNGLAVGMFGPFLTYFFFVKFHSTPNTVAILYLITNAISLGPIGVATTLADRYGSVKVTTILRFGQALLLIPFAYAPTFLLASIFYIVRATVQRAALPLRSSYVQSQADPNERAQVAALSNIPSQIAQSASPLLAGYLFDSISYEMPFVVGSILQFVSSIFYVRFFIDRPPPEEIANPVTDSD